MGDNPLYRSNYLNVDPWPFESGEIAAGQNQLQGLADRARAWFAPGEAARAGIPGKVLGVLGLDDSGARAATSWGDAAKHSVLSMVGHGFVEGITGQGQRLMDGSRYATMGGVSRGEDEGMGPAGLMTAAALPMGSAIASRVAPGVARDAVPIVDRVSRPELPKQAAFHYNGETFEGPIHGSALALAEDKFGSALWNDWKQPNGWQTAKEGYVTNEGRFVTRTEADDLLRKSGLIQGNRSMPGEHFGLHATELHDLQRKNPDLFSNPSEASPLAGMIYEGGVEKSKSSYRDTWKASPFNSDANGYVQGVVDSASGDLQIQGSRLSPDLIGKGKGLEMYKNLVDEAHREGRTVTSDTIVSPEAQRVYDALERRGYNVWKDPNSLTDKQGAATGLAYSNPVYKITPKPDYLYSNPSEASPLAGLNGIANRAPTYEDWRAAATAKQPPLDMPFVGRTEGSWTSGGYSPSRNDFMSKGDLRTPGQDPHVRGLTQDSTLYSNPDSASPLALLQAGRENKGITAYHGSPHDFDRFSMDKIGTGEGAQAYGHGLYFAEKEGVAKSYKNALANTSPGHMYEVRINADPEQFLDWDKPLSQQSEHVSRAASSINPAASPSHESNYASVINGSGFHRSLGDNAAQALRDAGIPGIRYLDQGSRTAGEGSRNYVVFNDKIIDIVKKYGIAAAASMYGFSRVNEAMAGGQDTAPQNALAPYSIP